MRISLAVVVLTLITTGASTWTLEHYVAPAAGLLYLAVVKALEKLNNLVIRRIPIGNLFTGLVIVSALFFSIESHRDIEIDVDGMEART